MPNDPYVYPNSQVLINKFDIRDFDKLQDLEDALYLQKHKDPLPTGKFDYAHLKAIHKHYFSKLYEWAGEQRTVNITKDDSQFCNVILVNLYIQNTFLRLAKDDHLKNLAPEVFGAKLAEYFNEINALHPFREGNGRTLRGFCSLLATQAGHTIQWRDMDPAAYLKASIEGFNGKIEPMQELLQKICITQENQQLKQIKKVKRKIR